MSTYRLHPSSPFVALSLWCATLAACAEPQPPQTAAVRDSAGIVIVESGLAAVASLPVWPLEDPRVVLGSAQGAPAEQFSHIIDGFLLSDGSIVLGDEETREIRVFSPQGRAIRSFGGRGEGPGEFRFLQRVARHPGDTIAVSGWPFGFLSRFSAEGDYVDGPRLGPFWPGESSFILADGSLLLDYYEGGHGNNVELWIAQGEGTHFRAQGHLIRAFADGTHDTLRPIQGPQMYKSGVWRRDLWVGRQPYGPATLAATDGDRVFVGETLRAEIEVRGLDGTLQRLHRWEDEPVGIGRADRDRIAAFEHYRLRQPDRAAHVDRWLADVVYPDSKPPLEALIADDQGTVWVRVPSGADGPVDRWIGFRDSGPVAQFLPPSGARLLEIGREHVLLVRADALDVERVELRELRRRAGMD